MSTDPIKLKLSARLTTQFSAWAATLESGQKLAIAAAPLLIWLGTMALGGLQAASTPVVSPVDQFLAEEMAAHRGPLPNALVLWKYSPSLRSRTYLGSASTYLNPVIFQEMDGISLSMDGWDEQLSAHLGKQVCVLNRSDYRPSDLIRIAFNRGGIEQLVSAPIWDGELLVGYVSVGFAEPLEQEELAIVVEQLRETAVLARERV